LIFLLSCDNPPVVGSLVFFVFEGGDLALVTEVRGGGIARDSAEAYQFTRGEFPRSISTLNERLSLDGAHIGEHLNGIFEPIMARLSTALLQDWAKKALARWIQEQGQSGNTVAGEIKTLAADNPPKKVITT